MTVYFESSITKIDKDGNFVLGTTLEKGEKLTTGETYKQVADGILETKSHDVAITSILDPEADSISMTLDPTFTNSILSTYEPGEFPEDKQTAVLVAETDETKTNTVVTPASKSDATLQDGTAVSDQAVDSDDDLLADPAEDKKTTSKKASK